MSGNFSSPQGFSAGEGPGAGAMSPSDEGKSFGPLEQSQRHKEVVKRAHDFYDAAIDYESTFRPRFKDDLKFAEADAYNNFQWPNSLRQLRDVDDRPCLTINKARQHNLMILNYAKQNKPEVKLRPTGGQATLESASALESLIRHIQYQGNFSVIHDDAVSFQIRAGFGVYRVSTKYVDEDSMDQDITPEAIPDPMMVLFDPNAKAKDKSDGRQAMVFEDLPRDKFDLAYPQYKNFTPRRSISTSDQSWVGKNKVRICEYFEKESVLGELIKFRNPTTGQMQTMDMDLVPEALLEAIKDHPDTQTRTTHKDKLTIYVIIGDTVAEENVWPGIYIPLIPVIGEETVIDGVMDRKGHTRAMLDPQRMYNYWASAAVEFGALQTKAPFIGAAEAIEGHEPLWNNANRQNYAVLTYNAFDDQDRPLQPPQRPNLPEQSPLYIQGMQTAMQEMMMVSGQYQSQMGQPGNERSGKAIQERQRQGDNATYHFIDNGAIAVRLFGLIVLDLIPKIYTEERVLTVLAQNGKDSIPIKIDPQAQQAYMEELGQDQKIAQRILNPSVGKYSVQSDIGPAYATAREEAFNAMTQILTQAPDLTALIGDILFKNADFPGADEVAERMLRMVNPVALGKAPPPEVQQLQEELQKAATANKVLMDTLAKAELRLVGKSEMRDIDVYKAETGRLKALADAGGIGPETTGFLLKQLISDAIATHLGKVAGDAEMGMAGAGGVAGLPGGNAPGMGQNPHTGGIPGNGPATGPGPQDDPQNSAPVPGARQAPDGQWYIQDPSRPGKYLRLKAQGQ